jgi:hypothetical protein
MAVSPQLSKTGKVSRTYFESSKINRTEHREMTLPLRGEFGASGLFTGGAVALILVLKGKIPT